MLPQSSHTVLVTGATGFTGRHLVRRLVGQGYAVRALARPTSDTTALRDDGVEVVVGDLGDSASLAAATDGVGLVYHLAANFREEALSREEMWRANAEGTENLLAACVRSGVDRVVHCSTAGVHGGVEGIADESSPLAPGDAYQQSKLDGENIARRVFVMIGNGRVDYQMIYVDDLVDGMLLCGTADAAIGETYLLTGRYPVELNDLVALVADIVGAKPPRLRVPFAPVYAAGAVCEFVCRPLGIEPPLYRRRVDFFRKNRRFDISKAERELGFKPLTSLRRGMVATEAWYRETGRL